MSNHQTLTPESHRDLRVRVEPGADLGDNVMAALITPLEFRDVQGSFPILFRREEAGGSFAAMALMGFENGENLFLDGDSWQAAYRPLSLAVQPFLIGRVEGAGGEGQVHIDMDHPRIAAAGEGIRVFEDGDQPSPYLERIAAMLGNLHAGYQGSAAFYEALERYELLEPFTFEVPLKDGSKHSLVGFHIVDEDKLRALDGDALGDLHTQGFLMPLFMALASLTQFGQLVARKNARLG